MFRKILFPLLLGLAGCAVLVSLGLWQVERLAWKEAILAEVDSRLQSEPIPLSTDVSEAEDEYGRVTLTGIATGDELHVLDSGTQAGTGYRVIARLDSDIGPVMADLGLLPIADKEAAPLTGAVSITGTLLWPDDLNDSTPEPDLGRNIWFARDVPAMAQALDTQELLVVVSTMSPADPRVTPLPVTTASIKNDHLEYAITWFLLAIVWAVMSLYLIRRTLRPTKD